MIENYAEFTGTAGSANVLFATEYLSEALNKFTTSSYPDLRLVDVGSADGIHGKIFLSIIVSRIKQTPTMPRNILVKGFSLESPEQFRLGEKILQESIDHVLTQQGLSFPPPEIESILGQIMNRADSPVQIIHPYNPKRIEINPDHDAVISSVVNHLQSRFEDIRVTFDYVSGSFYEADSWDQVGPSDIIISCTADHWMDLSVAETASPFNPFNSAVTLSEANQGKRAQWIIDQSRYLTHIKRNLRPGGVYAFANFVELNGRTASDNGRELMLKLTDRYQWVVNFPWHFPTVETREELYRSMGWSRYSTHPLARLMPCVVTSSYGRSSDHRIPSEEITHVSQTLSKVTESWSRFVVSTSWNTRENRVVTDAEVDRFYQELTVEWGSYIHTLTEIPPEGLLPLVYVFDIWG